MPTYYPRAHGPSRHTHPVDGLPPKVEEPLTLLTYKALREGRVDKVQVENPVTVARGIRQSGPCPLAIPLQRAGVGALYGLALTAVAGVGVSEYKGTKNP